ncbi:methyltransferase domain-containing protein [Microbacterium bovistercoris]|uniref:Methyltransferase domain-containing protein n=1 Tax=Microbacterium bovistercoris TaxID=2293570 RepID=A0A371NTP1_9MICO|nr:methyltransferase [Microbacterium bovistercoris]REJ05077.1 methyltransferase domain-containing protein [Microbacterium bovistercoris]
MPEFDFTRLRRAPDVEAPNLQAWDATDELLVRDALASGIPGDEIAVIGDEYGAITLALADAGIRGIRVHQDLVTGRRALARNAAALGMADGTDAGRSIAPHRGGDGVDGRRNPAFTEHELDETLLTGIRLVLLQLPKSLAELDEIADAIARWAEPDAMLIAGGRVKHMTLGQNDVLARHFADVQPQRAERKSRLLVARTLRRPDGPPPFPVSTRHALGRETSNSARNPRAEHGTHAEVEVSPGSRAKVGSSPATELTLCAYGGAFAGDRIDIGTRVLLDVMPDIAERPVVIDLGCGTGALAAAYALAHPASRVIATDRSAAAVRSARATRAANGIANVEVTLDDAGSELPDNTADLVLLNPPFHLGNAVDEAAGRRLIQAAARLTKPGGEVWTVFNSHLDHHRALQREVGPTEQVERTPKFTVTVSKRR